MESVIGHALQVTLIDSLEQIERRDWNRLVRDNNPFLRHEFLSALERHHCVGQDSGWQPQHIVVHDERCRLVGASPLYAKVHSHGEFVFDWSWAEAYQRSRLAYYPKLVSAIPYTPMSGERLLIAPEADAAQVAGTLITAITELAEEMGYSSAHWLFPSEAQKDIMARQGLIIRQGCQYHWHNQGYESFDHYLSHFASRKRKNVLKERRQVQNAGISFRLLHGDEISPEEWSLFHRFYREIYDRKWGFATLSLDFFQEIGRALPRQVVLVLAYRGDTCIAAALNLRSDHTLYGRHWGCDEALPGLHFETCYYQGLEYCLKHGLTRFEPGAQGEHKIARGFLPTRTWSAHWISHPEFRQAIARYTAAEAAEMDKLMQRLETHSPFRHPN